MPALECESCIERPGREATIDAADPVQLVQPNAREVALSVLPNSEFIARMYAT